MDILDTSRTAVRGMARRFTPRAVVGTRLLRYFAGLRTDGGAGYDVARACKWRVASGPFQGMRLPWWLSGSVPLGPKVLGCFESELHPAIERAIGARYKTIINVGCAEGYYVTGLALRSPGSQIIAYEGDPLMRQVCARIAKLNGVEAHRIALKEFCSPAELRTEPLDGAFVLVDVEGYELTLLDPDAVPGLASADILVERHDGVDAAITPTLLRRFAATHDANVVDISGHPKQLPSLEGVASERVAQAAKEFRTHSRGWIEFRRK